MADLEPFLQTLRQVPFVRAVRLVMPRRGQRDAVVEIRTPKGSVRLSAEVRRSNLSAESLERLLGTNRRGERILIFAPWVSEGAGRKLANGKINYVDLAGNCYLAIGKEYVAQVTGHRPVVKRGAEKGMRAPAYQALFALLAKPELVSAPLRVIGAAGGVNPQTASDVRARLVAHKFVNETRSGFEWNPLRLREGLELWLSGFTAVLRPHLLIGRFRSSDRDPSAFEKRLVTESPPDTWRLGGGAACHRLTGFYRGDETILYIEGEATSLVKKLRLALDRAGPVLIARFPGRIAAEGASPDTVHPLLVYADLLAESTDSAREAAALIAERFLKPFAPGAR